MLDAQKWKSTVSDLDNWLRVRAKYADEETVGIEEVRAKIRELMEDRGLRE